LIGTTATLPLEENPGVVDEQAADAVAQARRKVVEGVRHAL
jgi:hypothetical protein